jgi:hypothetical protein
MKEYISYMIIVSLSLLSLPLCRQVDCVQDSVFIFHNWYRQNELKLIVKDKIENILDELNNLLL